MSDWREELIKQMAKAAWKGPRNFLEWKRLDKITQETYLEEARAALAVAEPVIREQEDNRLREENMRLREERDKAVEEMWKASDQAQAFRKMVEERKA